MTFSPDDEANKRVFALQKVEMRLQGFTQAVLKEMRWGEGDSRLLMSSAKTA